MDPLSEGGDSEEEEQKKREKMEKEGSTKDKGKIPKRKERFLLLKSFVLSVQDDAVQQTLSCYICFLLCRYTFCEKMLSACQTLEVHLNGSKVISNRELVSFRRVTEICFNVSALFVSRFFFFFSVSSYFLRSLSL